MTRPPFPPLALPVTLLAITTGCTPGGAPASSTASPMSQWPMHSMERPAPPVVTPGPAGPPSAPPSDALVLFDGRDLSHWRLADTARADAPAAWKVENGWFEVVPGTGDIQTAGEFGDVQLHVEWATPSPAQGESQDRGNSGVFLMGRYEVQILDSYRATTYPDGQAGALYGQFPPLVNASRPPGEWQSYDIVFRRPRFATNGTLMSPARMTVLHNGILIHDAVELLGPTTHRVRTPYAAHADRLPIRLQDHSHPIRFRNIWVRGLDK